jgi:2OG-Fe(II) oxygenase superfamily
MPVLNVHDRGGYLVVDREEAKAVGSALSSEYGRATPFPHVVLDDFIEGSVLRTVLDEFPSSAGLTPYDRSQERLKYQYGPAEWTGRTTQNLFALFNSAAFVTFLEEMTGFRGLVPDPWYTGGGLHETKRGGHLGIHADFNLHRKLGLIRQLNLLVYLNEDWKEEYGGQLELWDTEMRVRESSVLPVFGRAVVFTTALDSYHGHPEPLDCPPERSRRSMALYYYTAPDDGLANVPVRTTQFQVRPGTPDRTDWRVKAFHAAQDWVPYAVRRRLARPSSD